MALILNIETTTEVCSVALSNNGVLIELMESDEEKAHASKLTPLIQLILKKNNITPQQLDAVAVSKGPGSYTGLRIGVSVAKGLCYSLNKPLIAVSTLQTLSWKVTQTYQKNNLLSDKLMLFCPMMDARRMEVYTAFFDINNKVVRKVSADIIDENSYLGMLDKQQVVFFGNGAEKCKPFISHSNAKFIDGIANSSQYMIALSEEAFKNKIFEDVAYFEPFYLKEFMTTTPKNKLF